MEEGVRDGHTEALNGAKLLGGEGHFRWLDTVGDRREGGSCERGLLKEEREREREEDRKRGGRKERITQDRATIGFQG